MDYLSLPNFDLKMYAYTTCDISSENHLKTYIKYLKNLFNKDDLALFWHEAGSIKSERFSFVRWKNVMKIYNREENMVHRISFSDENRSEFWASIEWFKIKGEKNINSFINTFGYQQNRLSLEIFSHAIDDLSIYSKYISFCKEISGFFDINYLFVFSPSKKSILPPGIMKLGTGLVDIFWINIFGKPYIDIIGLEKLMHCPAFKVIVIDNNHVLVQTTENVTENSSAEWISKSNTIKKYIGYQYFIKEDRIENLKKLRTSDLNSGTYSFWKVIKMIIRMKKDSKREFKDASFYAEERPEFDYKNIFIKQL